VAQGGQEAVQLPCVSVVVPALNEGRHIAAVVSFAFSDPLVSEVIVVDDSSTDEIAHLAQPLGGVIAARRALLRTLRFEDGYGVDAALLIDASLAGARVAEGDIGSLEHAPQPLQDLTLMANEVGRVIFERARWAGRMNVDQIAATYEAQCHATASLDFVMNRRKGRKKLLLLDLDGTVTLEPSALALAKPTGHQHEYQRAIDAVEAGQQSIEAAMTEALRYVHRNRFE